MGGKKTQRYTHCCQETVIKARIRKHTDIKHTEATEPLRSMTCSWELSVLGRGSTGVLRKPQ